MKYECRKYLNKKAQTPGNKKDDIVNKITFSNIANFFKMTPLPENI